MYAVKFGPSGNSQRFYQLGYKHTLQMPKYLAEMGLNAFEYSFGRGVSLSDDMAQQIGEQAKEYGITLSVHAPYYINFANQEDEMAEKSFNYCLSSAKKVLLLGGNRVVVHVASVGKAQRNQAVDLACKRLEMLSKRTQDEGLGNIKFCLETMGKINQIGTLEEIALFCTLSPIYYPTIDFGHLYARTFGEFCGFDKYVSAIEFLREKIGREKTDNMHVHFSKIEFSKAGGEVRHLTMEDDRFGPDFQPFADAICQTGITPTILSESDGTQDIDALFMKKVYEKRVKEYNS